MHGTPSKPGRTLLQFASTGSFALALLLSFTTLTIGCKSTPAPAPEPAAVPQTQVQPPAPAAHPFGKKHIYSTEADPKADIAAAITQARKQHKRIILDFGGDWCGDCQVLDIYFHESPNAELLAKNFVLVHVDIGRMDHNVDTAEKYQVPIKKGVPALAVLDAKGKLLYSQENKEFSHMSSMSVDSVTEFLNRWKS